MNKLTIPSILAATVLIAGIFAFMPVEKASTVHVTIGEKIDTIGTEVADMKTAVETMQTEVESIKSGVWAPYERTFMLTDEALTSGDDYEFACPDTGYRLMRINVEAMGIDEETTFDLTSTDPTGLLGMAIITAADSDDDFTTGSNYVNATTTSDLEIEVTGTNTDATAEVTVTIMAPLTAVCSLTETTPA